MNRLQTEFQRLYLCGAADADGDAPGELIDPQGRVRALVLELARPADWEPLALVWRGVQTDLGWPAPGIAVSGTDGLQLWFSLTEPVDVVQAQVFLTQLQTRYLPDITPRRLGLMPMSDASTSPPTLLHARPVPAQQAQTGHWAVFVAPDLAPVFAETPWLDIPPNDDGQAKLLRGLQSTTPAEWRDALTLLNPASAPAHAPELGRAATDHCPTPGNSPAGAAAQAEAGRFLQSVMNDEAAPLALRVEAAKALLRGAD